MGWGELGWVQLTPFRRVTDVNRSRESFFEIDDFFRDCFSKMFDDIDNVDSNEFDIFVFRISKLRYCQMILYDSIDFLNLIIKLTNLSLFTTHLIENLRNSTNEFLMNLIAVCFLNFVKRNCVVTKIWIVCVISIWIKSLAYLYSLFKNLFNWKIMINVSFEIVTSKVKIAIQLLSRWELRELMKQKINFIFDDLFNWCYHLWRKLVISTNQDVKKWWIEKTFTRLSITSH